MSEETKCRSLFRNPIIISDCAENSIKKIKKLTKKLVQVREDLFFWIVLERFCKEVLTF